MSEFEKNPCVLFWKIKCAESSRIPKAMAICASREAGIAIR